MGSNLRFPAQTHHQRQEGGLAQVVQLKAENGANLFGGSRDVACMHGAQKGSERPLQTRGEVGLLLEAVQDLGDFLV
jgi:hypothetical protein